jgi:DNA-binding SARP family transcriptional activator
MLASGVNVDIWDELSLARRIVSGGQSENDALADPHILMQFSMRLLPEWPDEWLLVDRERWDQLRLHALEMLAERLIASQQHVLAVEAAMIAVSIEPIRESAHRTLMRAYMAEGNGGNAIEQYRRYRRLLERELGVVPTAHMEDLVRELTSS